jgi:ubiquinol-cytochrome c reductase cytochrome c subunit
VIKRLIPVVACAASLCATAAFAQDTPRGNVANGKKLFDTVGCFECHGWVGQGGGAGPKLINPPAYAAYIVQLRTPRQAMPPFTTKVLSDQQAADIYAYVQTFPKPPDPNSIPLLRN